MSDKDKILVGLQKLTKVIRREYPTFLADLMMLHLSAAFDRISKERESFEKMTPSDRKLMAGRYLGVVNLPPRPALNDNLLRNVDELILSTRASNGLKIANVRTIADLVQKTEGELLKSKNFGKRTLEEIKTILREVGLSLGMKIDPDELETLRAQLERSFDG